MVFQHGNADIFGYAWIHRKRSIQYCTRYFGRERRRAPLPVRLAGSSE